MTKSGELVESFVVSGRVQGVSYRWFTQRTAERLGIRGWVRNRSDGCVEGLAAGTGAALSSFFSELEIGPRFAEVESLERVQAVAPPPAGFEIRR